MNGNPFWLRAAFVLAALIAIVFVILILTGCGTRSDDTELAAGTTTTDETTVPSMQPDPLEQRAVTFQADALERIAYVVTLDYAAKVEQARYDEQQRQTVAHAVEETEEPDPRDKAEARSLDGPGCTGNWSIPSQIVERESGCDYQADNPRSSACGAYQIIDSTWDNYGGYSTACDAPPEVQDAKAADLWADGAGCAHWSETDGC